MEKMRAARIAALGEIACELTEVRPPEEGQLLVRNHLAAICGSDLHILYNGISHEPFPHRPGYPGHEGVGEIVESRAEGFEKGELVLTCPDLEFSVGFSDYQTLPAASCIKLPAYDGPVEHLLMAQQFGTTLFALRRAGHDFTGKTVMVMGQGSAGVFFAFMAKRLGAAKVIVSDLSEHRLAHAKVTGADIAVQADPSGENVRQAVLDHTGGEGADFLIEAVGSATTFLQSVDLVRPGAQVLYFGIPDTKEPIPFNFHDFFRKRLQAYSHYGTQQEPNLVTFRSALELIATGQIDVSHLVTHRLSIEKIGEAMQIAQARADGALKVAITF